MANQGLNSLRPDLRVVSTDSGIGQHICLQIILWQKKIRPDPKFWYWFSLASQSWKWVSPCGSAVARSASKSVLVWYQPASRFQVFHFWRVLSYHDTSIYMHECPLLEKFSHTANPLVHGGVRAGLFFFVEAVLENHQIDNRWTLENRKYVLSCLQYINLLVLTFSQLPLLFASTLSSCDGFPDESSITNLQIHEPTFNTFGEVLTASLWCFCVQLIHLASWFFLPSC